MTRIMLVPAPNPRIVEFVKHLRNGVYRISGDRGGLASRRAARFTTMIYCIQYSNRWREAADRAIFQSRSDYFAHCG
jgi:hypothetical protein